MVDNAIMRCQREIEKLERELYALRHDPDVGYRTSCWNQKEIQIKNAMLADKKNQLYLLRNAQMNASKSAKNGAFRLAYVAAN